MTTQLNPYLAFQDEAKAAMEFYHSVFGGELHSNTFGESGMAGDPGDANKIMHAQLDAPNGMVLMASDTPSGMNRTVGDNISVSLSGADEAELRGYWGKLSDGATVTAPLEKAPWGDTFGMCTDRFGINWLVNIVGSPS